MQDRIGVDIGMEYRLGMQSQVSRLAVKRGPMTVSDLLVDAGVDHGCGKLKLHRPRAISRSLIGDLAAPHDRAPRWAVSRPIVIHDLFAVLLRTAGRFVNCFDFWNCPAFCCASSVAHRPTHCTSPFCSKHPTARRCMLAVVCTSTLQCAHHLSHLCPPKAAAPRLALGDLPNPLWLRQVMDRLRNTETPNITCELWP